MAQYTLVSSDGVDTVVSSKYTSMSKTIKTMTYETTGAEPIPLPNCDFEDVMDFVEWCMIDIQTPKPTIIDDEHTSTPKIANNTVFPPHVPTEEENRISVLKNKFLDQRAKRILKVITMANYLDVVSLMENAAQFINKSLIEGKTPEQLRAAFSIVNDMTKEEQERVEAECAVLMS
jgi:hypothetical protein